MCLTYTDRLWKFGTSSDFLCATAIGNYIYWINFVWLLPLWFYNFETHFLDREASHAVQEWYWLITLVQSKRAYLAKPLISACLQILQVSAQQIRMSPLNPMGSLNPHTLIWREEWTERVTSFRFLTVTITLTLITDTLLIPSWKFLWGTRSQTLGFVATALPTESQLPHYV